MSKIKHSENLFLEVAELNRIVKFLKEDGYIRILKHIIKDFGIVISDSINSFRLSNITGVNDEITLSSGIAFNADLEAIISEEDVNIGVVNNGVKKWIILSRDVSNKEQGTVSISENGILTGISTEFLSILRGTNNFPVKIKFIDSLVNVDEYEVVNVISDTEALIAGAFTPEQNIKYGVVGCFTPGFIPLSANQLIYEFDSYQITVIESATMPTISDGYEFILGTVEFVDNVPVIVDYRGNYVFNRNFTNLFASNKNDLISVVSVAKQYSTMPIVSFVIETGLKITSSQIIYGEDTNTVKIINGQCNYFGDIVNSVGNIPNDFFKNWILINRKNGQSCKIDSNTGVYLNSSEFDSKMLDSSGVYDFVLVPDFTDIEIKCTMSGDTLYNSVPSTHTFAIENVRNLIFLFLNYGTTSVKIEYRLKNTKTNNNTIWYSLNASNYYDEIESIQKILSDSTLIINVTDTTTIENYS